MGRFSTITDVVPEPCCINGTWLRPFCLGHHLLFRRLVLPFADAPLAKAERHQVLTGIAICAMTYENSLSSMLEGRWGAIMDQWSKDSSGHWWKRRRANWGAAESLFRAYLTDGYERPQLWKRPPEGGAVELTAEWELMLKCRLVAAGFSETEVLNGYLKGRWYDYHTIRELELVELMQKAALAGAKRPQSVFHRTFYNREHYLRFHPEAN